MFTEHGISPATAFADNKKMLFAAQPEQEATPAVTNKAQLGGLFNRATQPVYNDVAPSVTTAPQPGGIKDGAAVEVADRSRNVGVALNDPGQGIQFQQPPKGDVNYGVSAIANTMKEASTALFDFFKDKSKDGPDAKVAHDDVDPAVRTAPVSPMVSLPSQSGGMSLG